MQQRPTRIRQRLLMALLLVAGVSCHRTQAPAEEAAAPAKESPARQVMHSRFAGSWYPADPGQLRGNIEGYIKEADEELLDNVHALILPHAGYRFSGPTAGYGIKQVAGKSFDRVIVLGPSHRYPLANIGCLPRATHFGTPLGEVPLDRECIQRLEQFDSFQVIAGVHESEHSVQMEVPLLQVALPPFRLVPIVVGQLDAEGTRRMAEALLQVVDKKTLVVVSSDFTHFGPNYGYQPFSENIEENLRKLDMGAFEQIRARDPDGFRAYCDRTHDTICGRHPIAVLLAMLAPEDEVHLLKYDTSGRVTGDFRNSVSYLSIAVTGVWKPAPPTDGKPVAATPAGRLTDEDRRGLLRLARETLTYFYAHGRRPTPGELGIELTPAMKYQRGAFVTLTENHQLRGCIGDIFPVRPLYQAVMANVLNAALRDPRFTPVRPGELPGLHIEISALTPPHAVASYRDIELGKHGVVLRKRGRSAVYLPQVAPEQGWGIEETLSHLSRKAGLPSDAWREGARFEVFEADVFGEGDV